MIPKQCRVCKVLKTILLASVRETMMFGFDTVIVQERALDVSRTTFADLRLSANVFCCIFKRSAEEYTG